MMVASPSLYVDMLDAMRDHSLKPDSLIIAAIGSAPVPQQLVHDIVESFAVQRIYAMYGMTETSPLIFQSLASDAVQQAAATVGVVTDHMEAKVVDPEGRMVPMGTPGELWVRGYAIMLGYWGEEEKTKGIITPDGWLKTGDQFVLQEGGYGRVVGRLKDIIIRDNTNIFPIEIEEFFITHPDVMEAQAFGVPDPRLGEEMCVCIRQRACTALSEQQLREFCRGKLADFKTPRYFSFLPEFPRTATGKVDKLWLKKSVMQELDVSGQYLAMQ
ncbi:Acyl-CoA synthetase family member 2, mitochondrial [Zootermopsis nevadensis]|uniref:Medium-chain acyl-CoA ligase ACSF2, mitochondrial n=2 Tax=Zootermopsis nevadensis TaxID=136037 RepID=A0A067REQ1_ZOONE|nr:Acyl-CoA synthetase family member 2, mitochondrial [Zootermopsis nevadensis]